MINDYKKDLRPATVERTTLYQRHMSPSDFDLNNNPLFDTIRDSPLAPLMTEAVSVATPSTAFYVSDCRHRSIPSNNPHP
jgi:hypothetical protein